MLQLTSELEVLIATVIWLNKKGWVIESLSPAKGSGLHPIRKQEQILRERLEPAGVWLGKSVFKPGGPDVVASFGEDIWRFECKGLTDARGNTHKNNFDRAVASVVSYYDNPKIRLGLALPNDYLWHYRYSDKLPQTLREAVNLWVFLFSSGTVFPYPPTEPLPYPGAND